MDCQLSFDLAALGCFDCFVFVFDWFLTGTCEFSKFCFPGASPLILIPEHMTCYMQQVCSLSSRKGMKPLTGTTFITQQSIWRSCNAAANLQYSKWPTNCTESWCALLHPLYEINSHIIYVEFKCNPWMIPPKSSPHVHHISEVHFFPSESINITFYYFVPIFWLCLEELLSGYWGIHYCALQSIWWIMKAHRPRSNIGPITILRQ